MEDKCVHLKDNGECSLYEQEDRNGNPSQCDYLGYCKALKDFGNCEKAVYPTYE